MSLPPRNFTVPRKAMVLAAGLGLRMRPISDRLPKPLIAVDGRPMLDRAIDALDAAGIQELVVNTHHLSWMVEQHLRHRRHPKIFISHEPHLLETGGGIANALMHFQDAAFFVVNGDIIWRDGSQPALRRLAERWDTDAMDALLLLHPVEQAIGYSGPGDFLRHPDGRIERRGARTTAPVLFTGLQILHPRLFVGAPSGAFSLNHLYDRAISQQRLFGLIHDGDWCHVGTPSDISLAQAFLRSQHARAAGDKSEMERPSA